MVTWYRMASMPTTRLHLVGIWRWTLSRLKMFMQWSIRRTIMGAPSCTGQLGRANARWHAIWLKNIIWIHRTGTRCVEWKGRSCACPKCRIYTWCIIIVAVCDTFNSVTIFDKFYQMDIYQCNVVMEVTYTHAWYGNFCSSWVWVSFVNHSGNMCVCACRVKAVVSTVVMQFNVFVHTLHIQLRHTSVVLINHNL